MTSSLRQFKKRALARPEVKKAYDELADEFAFLDQVLKARTESGFTQAEVAERVGTTQSAIARLENLLLPGTRHRSSLCSGTRRPSGTKSKFAL